MLRTGNLLIKMHNINMQAIGYIVEQHDWTIKISTLSKQPQ
jgi:hypothetical protein